MQARPEDRLVTNPEATLERVGDDAVLYDRRSGQAHVLNASAARLWELCGGSPTADEVTARFAEGYDLQAADVRSDVEQLIANFRRLGLLE